MTCFSPIQGYESSVLTKNRKFSFTYSLDFARRVNGKPVPMTIKCRKCEGCRFDHSREWAVKILHEAQMFGEENSFITLTYNQRKIPADLSLDYLGHWTLFLKRLRKYIYADYGKRIRFYMVGEYGSVNMRPHYHAIIFGFDFPDKYQYLERVGNVICRSPLLERAWTDPKDKLSFGYSSVGSVSFASAAYVARYNMKKLIGSEFDGFDEYINSDGEVLVRPALSKRYLRTCPISGVDYFVEPERSLMSRQPGLAKSWFDQYAMSDIYSAIDNGNGLVYKDHTHTDNGMIIRPPRYYDELLKKFNFSMYEDIKRSRTEFMLDHADELTPDILRQRRECLLEKLKYKTRNIGDVYK